MVHQIQDHLLKLKGQNIPYGLHTFGRVPDKPLRDTTVDAIVSIDRSLLPTRPRSSPRRWTRESSPRERASWTA